MENGTYLELRCGRGRAGRGGGGHDREEGGGRDRDRGGLDWTWGAYMPLPIKRVKL